MDGFGGEGEVKQELDGHHSSYEGFLGNVFGGQMQGVSSGEWGYARNDYG